MNVNVNAYMYIYTHMMYLHMYVGRHIGVHVGIHIAIQINKCVYHIYIYMYTDCILGALRVWVGLTNWANCGGLLSVGIPSGLSKPPAHARTQTKGRCAMMLGQGFTSRFIQGPLCVP